MRCAQNFCPGTPHTPSVRSQLKWDQYCEIFYAWAVLPTTYSHWTWTGAKNEQRWFFRVMSHKRESKTRDSSKGGQTWINRRGTASKADKRELKRRGTAPKANKRESNAARTRPKKVKRVTVHTVLYIIDRHTHTYIHWTWHTESRMDRNDIREKNFMITYY